MIIPSAHIDSFVPSFTNYSFYFFFLPYCNGQEHQHNVKQKSGHFCLFLNLRVNTFNISPSSMVLALAFFVVALDQIQKVLSALNISFFYLACIASEQKPKQFLIFEPLNRSLFSLLVLHFLILSLTFSKLMMTRSFYPY